MGTGLTLAEKNQLGTMATSDSQFRSTLKKECLQMLSVKQVIGVLFILTILACTLLAVLGIWGLVAGDTVYQMIGTLIVVALGLGVSGSMLDKFFGPPGVPG